MWRLVTPMAFALASFGASASDAPRVVSVNVCTDQLVMLLADPTQIISLSNLSDDPRSSAMAKDATQFAKNNSQAEVIALQNPDIVVAGAYTNPSLVALLRSIGIEVVQFPITQSLREIPDDILRMGALLGQEDKARVLAADLDAELQGLPALQEDAPLAAFFMPNGFSVGAGTLSHDILTAGGARNLSDDLGFDGIGTLTMEQVILHQPDLLIGSQRFDGFALSEEMVSHPALKGFPVLQTSVDWVCGTPLVMNAIASVQDRVRELRAADRD